MQNEYIERMIKKLPVLRTAINLTQEQLGVSRQTIVAIENEKSPLSWSLYLAFVLLFQQYEESNILLNSFELFDKAFLQKIR